MSDPMDSEFPITPDEARKMLDEEMVCYMTEHELDYHLDLALRTIASMRPDALTRTLEGESHE